MNATHTPPRISLHERPDIGEIDLLIDHPKLGPCVKVGAIYLQPDEPGNVSACQSRELAELIAAAPRLKAALESVELRLTQTRLASNIGRESSVKKADFLRGQCESIAQDVRAVLATLSQ